MPDVCLKIKLSRNLLSGILSRRLLSEISQMPAFMKVRLLICCRASDFFQDWWAQVIHGAKNGGSFSEMMGPNTVDIWLVCFTYTLTQNMYSGC